ncbi:acyl-homoserine-lactone synthase [Novosphingobium sp. Gsoil 351]|uniref:acyl-homoserine-lactone synthase n=1 Tax=Novosphingobium sp. Gsoil 351 TaxID=2675225 RepID=UPI0012B4BB32|nr:acyl-homoserine-lactone synthase [Novosphingobium sp. Gsoil 351]QGN54091.1 autoinducer synthase [Novosphingobium sp. Gsoil 351]
MLHQFAFLTQPTEDHVLRSMFEARKRVFIDLLKWDVPVLEGRYELDQFDDEHAEYLVIQTAEGRHAASARLLETTRPHILGNLFPELCQTELPQGPRVREITRFCLDPELTTLERREFRNVLVSGLVEHALAKGIETYTGVADMGWMQQILAFGWHCHPLGLPQVLGGRMLGALSIAIDHETPALLAQSGIYRPVAAAAARTLELA